MGLNQEITFSLSILPPPNVSSRQCPIGKYHCLSLVPTAIPVTYPLLVAHPGPLIKRSVSSIGLPLCSWRHKYFIADPWQ